MNLQTAPEFSYVCGRFVQASSPALLLAQFGAIEVVTDLADPDYNVTPRREVTVILNTPAGERVIDRLRWGLVPRWAKDKAIGDRLINARSETVKEKPSFKSAYASRRCIIPVDGFYEWRAIDGQRSKQPVFIHANTGQPIAVAGIWESWRDPTDNSEASAPLRTCAILTTEANSTIEPIHNRMPVILDEEVWDAWLDASTAMDQLDALLAPAPDDVVAWHEVSTAVNNTRNNDSSLMLPLEASEKSSETLF
ncbi:MAG: hypothetical protein F2782_02220 [Actinobacteria bacterium]|nr:hypothetical protein [Actinomycetota bacterium]